MSKKRLVNQLQNLALLLLTVSALFLLTRLPMVQNIRWPDQVPGLFAGGPPAGGQEAGETPAGMFASVHLMVTGDSQYGRCGLLCTGADDAGLQSIVPLFREALGSAVPVGPAEDEAFRAALEGPGVYLELSAGPLPLEAVGIWLGEETGEEPGFSMVLRAMALTAGGSEAAELYLLDDQGGITLCRTALPISAVQSVCDDFSPSPGRAALPARGLLRVQPPHSPGVQRPHPVPLSGERRRGGGRGIPLYPAHRTGGRGELYQPGRRRTVSVPRLGPWSAGSTGRRVAAGLRTDRGHRRLTSVSVRGSGP